MQHAPQPIDASFFVNLLQLGNETFLTGCINAAHKADWPMVSGLMDFLESQPTFGPPHSLKATTIQPSPSGRGVVPVDNCTLSSVMAIALDQINKIEGANADRPNAKDLLVRYLAYLDTSPGVEPKETQALTKQLVQDSWACKASVELRDEMTTRVESDDLLHHDKQTLFISSIRDSNFEQATEVLKLYESSEQGRSKLGHAIQDHYLKNAYTPSEPMPMHKLHDKLDVLHHRITWGLVNKPHATMDFVEALWNKVADDGYREQEIAHMTCAMVSLYLDDFGRTHGSDEAFFDRLISSPFVAHLHQAMERHASLPRDAQSKWEQVNMESEHRSDRYVCYEPELLRSVLCHSITPLFDVCRPLLEAAAKENGPSFEEFILPQYPNRVTVPAHNVNRTFDYLVDCGHDPNRVRGADKHWNAPASAMDACAGLNGDELKRMLPLLLERGLDPNDDSIRPNPVDKPLWESILLAHKAKQASMDLLAGLAQPSP